MKIIQFVMECEITLRDEEFEIVEKLNNDNRPAGACKYIMDTKHVPLYVANCIRKAVRDNCPGYAMNTSTIKFD